MSGFVLIHRSLWYHPAFRDFSEAAAFAWMISRASWQQTRVRYRDHVMTLERGQFCMSTRDIGKVLGWTESKVRRFLERLKNDAMIDACSDAGPTRITICNYDEYQSDRRTHDAPSDAGPTQDRRTADAQNKEGKEVKEKKEGAKAPLSAEPTLDLIPSDPVIPSAEQDAFNAYNVVAARIGISLAQKLTKARKSKLRQRLKECGGIDGWRVALEKLEASSYCRGINTSGWSASFDFLLSSEYFTRLMEGRYDDRKPQQPQHHQASRVASTAERRERLARAAARAVDPSGAGAC